MEFRETSWNWITTQYEGINSAQFNRFIIIRLNSGNFGIFDFTEPIINLDCPVCRAWKIVSNGTKICRILWESDFENSFWNFCVGVWVGGQPRANFFQSSKVAQFNLEHFDMYLMGATGRGRTRRTKNWILTWVKIAWVGSKSSKP